MRILVVYYSRTGITARACRAIADALEARETPSGQEIEVQIEELVDKKNRDGALGWLRGGKDAATKAETEIEPTKTRPEDFDLVVLGTPVWAGTCAPAVRTYCTREAQNLPMVAFVATMGGRGDAGAFRDMQQLTGRQPVATLSLIDKAVRAERQDDYLAKVDHFADELLTTLSAD